MTSPTQPNPSYLEMRDCHGQPWLFCTLCNRWVDDKHLACPRHMKNVKWLLQEHNQDQQVAGQDSDSSTSTELSTPSSSVGPGPAAPPDPQAGPPQAEAPAISAVRVVSTEPSASLPTAKEPDTKTDQGNCTRDKLTVAMKLEAKKKLDDARIKMEEAAKARETGQGDTSSWSLHRCRSRPDIVYYYNRITKKMQYDPPEVLHPWTVQSWQPSHEVGYFYFLNMQTGEIKFDPPPDRWIKPEETVGSAGSTDRRVTRDRSSSVEGGVESVSTLALVERSISPLGPVISSSSASPPHPGMCFPSVRRRQSSAKEAHAPTRQHAGSVARLVVERSLAPRGPVVSSSSASPPHPNMHCPSVCRRSKQRPKQKVSRARTPIRLVAASASKRSRESCSREPRLQEPGSCLERNRSRSRDKRAVPKQREHASWCLKLKTKKSESDPDVFYYFNNATRRSQFDPPEVFLPWTIQKWRFKDNEECDCFVNVETEEAQFDPPPDRCIRPGP